MLFVLLLLVLLVLLVLVLILILLILVTLEHLERLVRASANSSDRGAPSGAMPTLEDDYALLELNASATDADLKRAYRRLMSRHHPDKLIARGLPEEMVKVATEQTQAIKAAYERIKAARSAS